MRKRMLVSLALLFAVSAHAHTNLKRIATAAPRAVARTAENMVTLKDRRLALNQWILMAAVMVDAKTSLDLTHRCLKPCENYSFVWGAHPPAAKVYGLLGLTGFYYSTINQASWEASYSETDPAARLFERYFFLCPAGLHAWFAFRNAQIQPAASASPPGQNNLAPELTTAYAPVQ